MQSPKLHCTHCSITVWIAKTDRMEGEGALLTRRACEDLSHLEGLREEALDLPGARHRLLVLFTELIHTQDGNDILQILVVLHDMM